ncbi:glycerophosphodiester phosphodiesterase family protein [Erythrobacter sp. HL-111]|uniref:glycerophosphodiester phosphodiesterase family protein n=1 Tax=Erythrobacter sp. HL-111 TaxID=1798193 RepID=UPI0006D9815A|nr:glycerophosphodiester phosphodiesterase family protein [Erythrobacter sp. HL-111]KPP94093.1 MAG: Glycerophosphoryl diester phosphodiesterase [Erythrobacteraceae bacterium HL-111]SDS62005.1 Glycerophosphoryl diester phosphodiesterase [Erythrobacter sp. HL-111]
MTARAAPAWLTAHEYAHRGLHSPGVPENSLAAAEAAIAAGLGVECDVQRSRDDHPMVFHDWDLERLAGETGATEDRVADDLEALRLLGTDQHPVRLTTFLEVVAGRVPLLIEIKSRRGYDVERSCVAVSRLLNGYAGLCAVMSFDPRVSRWFRRHSPGTPCGLVMREDERGDTQKAWQRRLAVWIARPDFLAYHIAALPSGWVAKLRSSGLPVLTWTVDSPETRKRALAHADALIAEGAGLA